MRLETKSGIVGWGEACSLTHRSTAIASLVHSLAEHLIGLKAFDTRKIIEFAKNQYGQHQLGADLYCALSAIEIAAWDAVGKHLDAPVCNLIGGACHEVLPLYVNMYSEEPQSDEELAQEILKQKNLGFKAARIYPFMAGGTLDNAVITIGKVRDAVGSEFGLAVALALLYRLADYRDFCPLPYPSRYHHK